MILSYRDERTERFSQGEFVAAFQGFEQQRERRLAILNAAPSLDSLRTLPSNRLEALKGDRAGSSPFALTSSGASASNGLVGSQDQATLRSLVIIDERRRLLFKRIVHPGAILQDELDELGITPTEFARQINVAPNRVSQIISGKRAITGDTALRFGHWFGIDPQFWLNLQTQYDLAVAERQIGDSIRRLPTKAAHPV
jgi:antitoxin HigA-1